MDLIDTADMYGPFTNEEVVGRALAGRPRPGRARHQGRARGRGPRRPTGSVRDGSPEHVREGIDASLRRLGVDHVDLYQLHRVDEQVPVEETWGAMAEVVAAGKASAIGMSEATVDELERAHAIHPVASVQSELSLWTRDRLDDVLPWCREHDVGVHPVRAARPRLPDRHGHRGLVRRPRLPRPQPALHARGARRQPRDRRPRARRSRSATAPRRAGRARVGARAGRADRADPGDDEGRAGRGERAARRRSRSRRRTSPSSTARRRRSARATEREAGRPGLTKAPGGAPDGQ